MLRCSAPIELASRSQQEGSAIAATLNPPMNVTVPASSTGTVHVAWTASVTGPGAVAPTGNYAERKAGGPAWVPACDSSPSALVAATDRDDTVPADGDYTYRVTAVYHSWTATSDTSRASTPSPMAPATSTLTFPGAGPYSDAGWTHSSGATRRIQPLRSSFARAGSLPLVRWSRGPALL